MTRPGPGALHAPTIGARNPLDWLASDCKHVVAEWQLQEAKHRLSQVVERADAEGPRTITVRGRPKAIVLSELVRPAPYPAVVAWIDAGDASTYYLSVITLGELQQGIARLVPSERRAALERWLTADVVQRFRGHALPIDEAVALAWGALQGEALRAGAPLPAIDALIAATARVHGLTVMTRNVRDLERRGVPVINPWPPGA